MKKRPFGFCIACITMPVSSYACSIDEVKTYEYDALRQLIGVEVVGGPADGENRNYQLDDAGNRTRVIASNVHGSADARGVQPEGLLANTFSVAFSEQARRSKMSKTP